jgi:hypothetical protein
MGDPAIGKSARNEQRRVRAQFYNGMSLICVLVVFAIAERYRFMPVAPDPAWDWDWHNFWLLLGQVYPALLFGACAWSSYSRAQKAAGEIED